MSASKNPLRILIYGINFSPELTGVGKYTGEMAHWLALRGYEIKVITAPPYYPQWRVSDKYHWWGYRRESNPLHDGRLLHVWRCPVWVPKKPGTVTRLLHLASFALSSLPIALCQVVWKPDVVLTVEPTLACAPAALITASMCGAKSWLHVQDLEIDAAFGLGLLRSSWAHRVVTVVERYLLSRFDKVSSISKRMLERLSTKGVRPNRLELLPNWVDLRSVYPLNRPSVFRSELKILHGQVVALYAGNLGEKQGFEIIVEAAKNLQQRSDIVFVVAGDGIAGFKLKLLAADLTNIRWMPLQPVERLNDLLNLADIHLLPQREDAADLVLPSKLTGMLASARPIVATAVLNTEIGEVVSGCGFLVRPGDAVEFSQAVVKLAEDSEMRQSLGLKARIFAEKRLQYDQVMTMLAERLDDLTHRQSHEL